MSEIIEDVFHGTTIQNAKSIIKDNKYYPGKENVNDQFLGEGIYFFKNNQHAVMWNLKKARDEKILNLSYKKYIKKYTVIKSELKYKKENLLDLNDANDIAKYDKICRKIKQKFENEEEFKTAKRKERAIINFLYRKNLIDGIFVIRKISGQKNNVDENNVADYIERDILCVKNDCVINNIGKCIKICSDEYNNIKAISF